MTISGIGTRNQGSALVANPSRIAYKPVENRVQANQAVENRVQQQAVANRVEANQSGNRLDIAA